VQFRRRRADRGVRLQTARAEAHGGIPAIQADANIKALQNMLGHESAGLTLHRYGHLYGLDVEAVGVAMNALLTRKCGQNVVTAVSSAPILRALNTA
jgi:hypothetical protein